MASRVLKSPLRSFAMSTPCMWLLVYWIVVLGLILRIYNAFLIPSTVVIRHVAGRVQVLAWRLCNVLPRNMAVRLNNRQAKTRSEEHTSELQSRPHLVCRL